MDIAELQCRYKCKCNPIQNRNTCVTWFIIYWHPCRPHYSASHTLPRWHAMQCCYEWFELKTGTTSSGSLKNNPASIKTDVLRLKLDPRSELLTSAFTRRFSWNPKNGENNAKYFSSVCGRSAQRTHASWLTVSSGFGGRHVFHNDMERSLDMRARGHPALSLLIPDSSFSLDSTRFNYQARLWVLLDRGDSQGRWTCAHTHSDTHTHTRTESHF